MKRRLGARDPLAIDAEKIAEQQARLDAIVWILENVNGNGIRDGMLLDAETLARGTPRRECAKLVKRYGKEKR